MSNGVNNSNAIMKRVLKVK